MFPTRGPTDVVCDHPPWAAVHPPPPRQDPVETGSGCSCLKVVLGATQTGNTVGLGGWLAPGWEDGEHALSLVDSSSQDHRPGVTGSPSRCWR